MMSEERERTPELSNSVLRQIQQIVTQNQNLLDKNPKELETVLATLAGLPFKDEIQQVSFLEHVQRMQGFHIIQLFNLGVAPLQETLADSSAELLEEVIKLFEICFSFCYTTDVSKRVAFDYYVRALKFCFPSEPKQCLSTGVVSKLLELVQILQEGELAEIVSDKTEQDANAKLQIHGPSYFFGEILQIFELRRHEDFLVEIIEQTVRIASADATIKCIQQHAIGKVTLQSEHVVSPVFLTNWMKLLKFVNVSNGFAFSLAKADSLSLSRTEQIMPFFFGGIVLQTSLTYNSSVCSFVTVLEEMQKDGIEVILPHDKDRLDIFFNHLNHLCDHANVAATSLKLLAATSISNEVLKEALDQFFSKGRMATDLNRGIAFELVFEVLSLLPDGKLVKRVLNFWTEAFSYEPGYQTLVCLLTLFVEVSRSESFCLQGTAERILDFLGWLPRPLLLSIRFWRWFLSWFIKMFPTTFQRRPEVLVFIHKVAKAAQVSAEQRAYVTYEQVPTLQCLDWVSEQNSTEMLKNEMIWFLMCCTELTDLAKVFKEREKQVFRECCQSVASNQALAHKGAIMLEIIEFVKRFADKKRPMKTIPNDILKLLSLVSKAPISGERRVKVLQMSKKSAEGMLSGLRILQLIEMHEHALEERTNDYFNVLYSAFVEVLQSKKELCEQFYKEHYRQPSPPQVQDVWSFVTARLMSLGLFQDKIDSRCCLPVLERAWGFSSPFEMLQLFSQVRSSAMEIVNQLGDRKEVDLSSLDAYEVFQSPLLETFVSSVITIVRSNVLSALEKLLIVKKVCNIFVSRPPKELTGRTVENALRNLIPHYSSSSSRNQDLHLGLHQIVAMLENPTIVAQLSRIPAHADASLCSVLSTGRLGLLSKGRLVDIYCFIGSQENLDQSFFHHFLPILEVAVQESNTVEDVLEILRQLVCILHDIPAELIPFSMLTFGYLLQSQIKKEERQSFLNDTARKWEFSSDPYLCAYLEYLEVPRLLWKVFSTAGTPAKRYELIGRVQEILKKLKEVEQWEWAMGNLFAKGHPDYTIRRRISCCELEWLVLHSSFPTEDAALAFSLSCLSSRECLGCFTFSDAQIEDGFFKFVPKEKETTSELHDQGTESTSSVEAGSFVTEQQEPIVTPVLLAKEVIYHLKRVLGQEEDLFENAFSLWRFVFNTWKPFSCTEPECATSRSFLDDYVQVFLSILKEASSKEVMFHWARLDQHHVVQCSDVILKACKWNSRNEDDIDKDALLNLQTVVSTTLEKVRMKTRRTSAPLSSIFPWTISISYPEGCFRRLKSQLKHLHGIFERGLPIEVTTRVLGLFQISVQAGVSIGEIVSTWSCKQQALKLVENIQSLCEGDEFLSQNLEQSGFAWQLLKAFGRFCMNSCEDLLTKFKELIVLHDPEDAYGLNRLPNWREMMVADGFPPLVIDSWCAAFLMTPLDDLTSRDVDAIVDLNSRSLGLVTSVSQLIKQVIFPQDGFQVTQGKGIKESPIKERIRLARLLGEFINILKGRKPEENRKDAVVRDIVADACVELCRSHENINRRRNDLYKIHGQKLKALFTEIFGKQRKSEDGQTSIQDCGMTHKEGEQELRVTVPVNRQSSYLHENLPSVLSHAQVYEPMLLLLRRWLSGIMTKPTLASHTLEIVQLLFSIHPSDVGPGLLQELHGIIQTRILSLEANQALVAQLQAAGYNQSHEGIPDLWSSRAVELPCYLSKRESWSRRLFTKKMIKVLRPLWNEWKDILDMFYIASIKVGEDEVCTKDLFGVQASLDEMEEQAAAVKEVVKQINSEDLDRRVKQLMRLEQQHRARIEKLYKNNRNTVTCNEMKKFVAVWENRFLEQVKLCSERIPGCYAPNGFHSEKPVICALSVDNRILTVFKEEKPGRREEIENVEVKLFEAGLYVYGLHTSGHDYVTDELWAAFYKMLLEKGLVPSIVLSNEGPGFDWIKNFIKPATSHLCPWKWELHRGIVPREEDYLDYLPISAAICPALHGLREFLTLTKENVSSFNFSDFKDVNIVEDKERQTKHMTGKAIQELQHELQLLHGDNEPIRKALKGKLTFAVKETVKRIVDGVQATEETVKELIDMEKLAFGHPEVERTEESRQQYAAAVLRACEHAR